MATPNSHIAPYVLIFELYDMAGQVLQKTLSYQSAAVPSIQDEVLYQGNLFSIKKRMWVMGTDKIIIIANHKAAASQELLQRIHIL